MSNRDLGSCIELIYNEGPQGDDVARVYAPIIARYLQGFDLKCCESK